MPDRFSTPRFDLAPIGRSCARDIRYVGPLQHQHAFAEPVEVDVAVIAHRDEFAVAERSLPGPQRFTLGQGGYEMVKPTKGRRGPPGSSRGPLFSFGSRFDGWPSFELFAERGQVRARDRNRGLARRASASPFAGAPERRRFITRGHHSSAANLRSNGAPLAMLPPEAPIPRQRQRRLRGPTNRSGRSD